MPQPTHEVTYYVKRSLKHIGGFKPEQTFVFTLLKPLPEISERVERFKILLNVEVGLCSDLLMRLPPTLKKDHSSI